jgi:hypothetical protein
MTNDCGYSEMESWKLEANKTEGREGEKPGEPEMNFLVRMLRLPYKHPPNNRTEHSRMTKYPNGSRRTVEPSTVE